MDPKYLYDLLPLISMLVYVTMPVVNQSKTVITLKTIIFISSAVKSPRVGQDSIVSIVTHYRMDGPGIKPGGGEIFHNCPDQPWGPPSLLSNEYWVSFPAVKWPGCGIDHPPPSSAEVKERVQLYLQSTPWAFMACSRVNFTVYLYHQRPKPFSILVPLVSWTQIFSPLLCSS
jgi:hypothetical protein